MTLATRKKLVGRPNHQEASSSYISCDNASRLAKAHVAYVICNDIPIRQAMNVRTSFSKRKRCKRTFLASQRRLPFCVSCKKRALRLYSTDSGQQACIPHADAVEPPRCLPMGSNQWGWRDNYTITEVT